MAIEVTTFIHNTDPNNNIDEVHDWLVANAAEYFPGGIETDTDKYRIHCYPIEGDTRTVLGIPFWNSNANAQGYMVTKNDTGAAIANANGTSYSTHAYKKAARTDCGIALLSDMGATWFIVRADNGNICAVIEGTPGYNTSNNWRFVLGDLERSSYCVDGKTAQTPAQIPYANTVITNGQTTVLAPIAFPGGSYSTSLFITPFTQANFSADLQTVLIDGQEYVYDGLFALKG